MQLSIDYIQRLGLIRGDTIFKEKNNKKNQKLLEYHGLQ